MHRWIWDLHYAAPEGSAPTRRGGGGNWALPKGSNENFYSIVTLGDTQYLVLVLEVFPRNSALNWATAVIKNHSSLPAIVVTHAFTYADSTRMDRCDGNSAASFAVAQDNDGEQIWEKFASKYPNIKLVLSGHVVQGDGTGHRTDLGVNGNLVNEMLSDYQTWPNGGNGYIRLITVKPVLNQVSVRTYSPYLNSWLTDSHNQFTVPFNNSGLQKGTTMMVGKVKDASNCGMLSGALASNGSASDATDSSGKYSIPSSGPGRYTLRASRSGYIAPNQVASALVNQPSPGKVLLAKFGTLAGKANWKLVPVAGAKVVLNGGVLRLSTSTTTASNGSFSFGNVPYGSYTITASIPGTTIAATYTISVSAGNSTYVNFNLQ
jgi:hypothetical protein